MKATKRKPDAALPATKGSKGRDTARNDALDYALASLGRDLKAAREHARLTQAELAKKLKTAQTTVSDSEAGKIRVSADYVASVLKACGLPQDWKASPQRVSRPLGRGLLADKPMFSLALLREVKRLTQTKVAEASGIRQGDISKLEAKERLDDVQVSTLRNYAAALGGEVQIVVVLDGKRYVLTG
jgi:transcriptional regulator with XRE-family HTH domain